MKNGIFIVILWVILGCKKTNDATIAIPKADFAVYNNNCKAPCNVSFTNLTNIRFGTDYIWDFGDSTTSKEINPRHLYSKAGKYVVRLTTSNRGVGTVFEKFVTIQQDIPLGSFKNCRVERVILKQYPKYKSNSQRWDDVNAIDSLPDYIWILKDASLKEMCRSDDLYFGVNLDTWQLPYSLLRGWNFKNITDFTANFTLTIADDDVQGYDTMTEVKFRPIDYFPQYNGSFSNADPRSIFTIKQDGVEVEILLIWT